MAQGDSFIAIKPTDTSRASDVTVTDDPHLFVRGLNSSERYDIVMCLLLESGAGEFQIDTVYSGGSWSMWSLTSGEAGYGGTTGNFQELSGDSISTGSPPGRTGELVYFRGSINPSTEFGLQWAQDTTNTDPSTIKAGSWLRLTEVTDII